MSDRPTTTTVRRLDVDLQAGRCLRLALELDPDGAPECLAIALGWSSGEVLSPSVIRIPGAAVPGLIEALGRLTEED